MLTCPAKPNLFPALENALTEWGHLLGDDGAPVPKSLIRTTKPVPNEADSFFWDLSIIEGPAENL